MLAAHVFKAFQGDVEIFCFSTLAAKICFSTLAAKTQLTDAFTTSVLPRTVNHHLDVSFHTCGFHIQQQTGRVTLDSASVLFTTGLQFHLMSYGSPWGISFR